MFILFKSRAEHWAQSYSLRSSLCRNCVIFVVVSTPLSGRPACALWLKNALKALIIPGISHQKTSVRKHSDIDGTAKNCYTLITPLSSIILISTHFLAVMFNSVLFKNLLIETNSRPFDITIYNNSGVRTSKRLPRLVRERSKIAIVLGNFLSYLLQKIAKFWTVVLRIILFFEILVWERLRQMPF